MALEDSILLMTFLGFEHSPTRLVVFCLDSLRAFFETENSILLWVKAMFDMKRVELPVPTARSILKAGSKQCRYG